MSLSYYVKMPEGDSSTKPEIYFPSENYVLEGKISDDSTGLYLKIDNVNVEFWNLFGEREDRKEDLDIKEYRETDKFFILN